MKKILFILCVLLLSVNIQADKFDINSITFSKKIPFEELPDSLEKDIADGTMAYVENQQCFLSTYRVFYKDSILDHINVYAVCTKVNPNKKINWDSPEISTGSQKTIHIIGKSFPKKMLNSLKSGIGSFVAKKLYYYKSSHKNYKKDVYYYSE